MWKEYNPNPKARRVGDCTVRAISKVTGQKWVDTYIDLCLTGLMLADMPTANNVWGEYLKEKGFCRHLAPMGMTVAEFADQNEKGRYVLALSGHVVAVCDGDYFDTWDSGEECPVYYWEKCNV